MALRDNLGQFDTLVTREKLVLPKVNLQDWSESWEVYSYLGTLIEANITIQALRKWQETLDFLDNTTNRSIRELDKTISFDTLVLIEATGVYVSGGITAESERIIRNRKEGSDTGIYTVGAIEYSVGDEDEALYATVKLPWQHGSGNPEHFRGVKLSGTIPAEVPRDPSPPFERSRVQTVAAFVQEKLISV